MVVPLLFIINTVRGGLKEMEVMNTAVEKSYNMLSASNQLLAESFISSLLKSQNDIPNEETLEAMAEVEKEQALTSFSSISELSEWLDENC